MQTVIHFIFVLPYNCSSLVDSLLSLLIHLSLLLRHQKYDQKRIRRIIYIYANQEAIK